MKNFLIVTSFLVSFFLVAASVHANTNDAIPKKRIVVLVYDDSSSMFEGLDQNSNTVAIDNWKYANYALQSFVGLLDESDVLKVVPMSASSRVIEIGLGERSREKEIENIRSWVGAGNTPVQSIHTAVEELKETSQSYPDAELWLVVLTDGVFTEFIDSDTSQDEKDKERKKLDETLWKLTTAFHTENRSFNGALVTIESNLIPIEKKLMTDFKNLFQRTTDGTLIESSDDGDIVSSINQVAALITNRDPSTDEIFDLNPKIKGDKITLTSPLPLERITLIEQSRQNNSPFNLANFKSNEVPLRVTGPFRIETPDDPNQLSPSISGSVTHIQHQNAEETIPEGEITLTLKEPLSKEQREHIQIIAEPALDFTFSVSKLNEDGSVTKDKSAFFAGSKMKLDVSIMDSKANRVLELDDETVALFEVTGQIEDEELELAWNEEDKQFTGNFKLIEKDDIAVKVKVRIKGLYQKEKSMVIHGYPIRNLELQAVNPEWRAKLNELNTAEPMVVKPMIDGEAITEGELTEIWSNVTVSTREKRMIYELSQKGNTILLTTKPKWPLMLASTGKIPVDIQLVGKYPGEKAKLTLYPVVENIPWYQKYLPFIAGVLSILLVLLYIIGILIKPRFKSKSSHMSRQVFYITNGERRPGRTMTEDFKTNFIKRWLIPYVPEKKTIDNLTFKASKGGEKILLARQSQSPEMVVVDMKLGERSGEKDIRIYSNDSIVISQSNKEEHYVFHTGE